MVFAVGECLHGTVQGPVVVDLAQPQLIGRYMAVSSLSWQGAFIIGPAIGGAPRRGASGALAARGDALARRRRLAAAGATATVGRAQDARAELVRPEPVGVEVAPAPGMATRPSG